MRKLAKQHKIALRNFNLEIKRARSCGHERLTTEYALKAEAIADLMVQLTLFGDNSQRYLKFWQRCGWAAFNIKYKENRLLQLSRAELDIELAQLQDAFEASVERQNEARSRVA